MRSIFSSAARTRGIVFLAVGVVGFGFGVSRAIGSLRHWRAADAHQSEAPIGEYFGMGPYLGLTAGNGDAAVASDASPGSDPNGTAEVTDERATAPARDPMPAAAVVPTVDDLADTDVTSGSTGKLADPPAAATLPGPVANYRPDAAPQAYSTGFGEISVPPPAIAAPPAVPGPVAPLLEGETAAGSRPSAIATTTQSNTAPASAPGSPVPAVDITAGGSSPETLPAAGDDPGAPAEIIPIGAGAPAASDPPSAVLDPPAATPAPPAATPDPPSATPDPPVVVAAAGPEPEPIGPAAPTGQRRIHKSVTPGGQDSLPPALQDAQDPEPGVLSAANPTTLPEPGSMALLGTAIGVFAAIGRRRRA